MWLLFYVLKGVVPVFGGKPELWAGLAVAPVFLIVWAYMHARVKKIDATPDEGGGQD